MWWNRRRKEQLIPFYSMTFDTVIYRDTSYRDIASHKTNLRKEDCGVKVYLNILTSAPLLGSGLTLWWTLFGQSRVISDSACSYWLLHKEMYVHVSSAQKSLIQWWKTTRKNCSSSFSNNCKHSKATQRMEERCINLMFEKRYVSPLKGRSYATKQEGEGLVKWLL